MRKVEEHKGKNIEKSGNEKKEKTETISSKLNSNEQYNAGTAKTGYENLLGFAAD